MKSNIQSLKQLIQNIDPNEIYLEYWDIKNILIENKSLEDVQKDRIKQLKKQGIAQPIHKHNIVNYGNSK
jgi:hypothetical protein